MQLVFLRQWSRWGRFMTTTSYHVKYSLAAWYNQRPNQQNSVTSNVLLKGVRSRVQKFTAWPTF